MHLPEDDMRLVSSLNCLRISAIMRSRYLHLVLLLLWPYTTSELEELTFGFIIDDGVLFDLVSAISIDIKFCPLQLRGSAEIILNC